MYDLEVSLPLESPRGEGRRFHELDSMRGVAAFVVLFHHFTHMFYPSLLTGSDAWSVIVSPLISGHESVILFFLLSGFVLSLPFLRGKSQPYSVFVCRRVLRIYGPYIVALALALAGCSLWANRLGTSGWESGTWSQPVDLRSVIQHVAFIGNYDYNRYNTSFWSLVYEMRISLIFPLLFVIANRLRVSYTLLIIAICTALGVRAGEYKFLVTFEYIGVFLIGVLLAKNLESLSERYRRLGATQRGVLTLASLSLYFGGGQLSSIGPLWHSGDMSVAVGAAGLIIIGLNALPARRILNSGILSFLGRISYSLYLVHGTVLFAMAVLLRDKVSHPVFFLLYLPAATLLSWVFYVLVEKPFMLMSRNVGRRKAVSRVEPVLAVD